MKTRTTFLALVLGTTALTSAQAQNYEYDNPNWYDGEPTQPNLAQINVTSDLHSSLKAYFDDSGLNPSVVVAVLDGLADFNHVDLSGQGSVQIVYNSRFRRYSDHGTHVSGIVAAAQNDIGIVGVNPYATLLNIPVFDGNKWLPNDLGLSAFQAAAAAGARVVNMSYGPASASLSYDPARRHERPNRGGPPGGGPPGGGGGGGGGGTTSPSRANLFFDGELDMFASFNADMVFVRAAGNDGLDIGNEPFSGDAASALSNLLVVGSVDGSDVISSFSNRPGDACIGGATGATCSASDSNALMNFFLVAPGESIVSDLPNNYVGTMSGTSMAAPHVSGAAALVFQNALAGGTSLTPGEVASILKLSAQDLGAAGVDAVYGWGRLDVAAALQPVGDILVPTGGTSGSSTSLQSTDMSMSSMVNAGAFEEAISGMLVLDGFERAYVVSSPDLRTASSPFDTNVVQQLSAAVSAFPTTIESDDGKATYFAAGSSIVDGGFSALRFDDGKWAVSAALGASASYLSGTYGSGTAYDRSLSYTMADEFFTGSGNVVASLDKAMFLGSDWRAGSRLTLSALVVRTAPEDLYREQSGALGTVRYTQSQSNLAKIGGEYDFGSGLALNFSYGLLSEDNQLLGMRSSGALGLADGTTHMATVGMRADLSETMSISAFAEHSSTSSPALSGSIFGNVDHWRGSKFGIGFTESNVLSDHDAVRLKLVRPWQIDQGTLALHLPVSREFDGTVNYEDRVVAFGTNGLPWEVGLEYLAGGAGFKYGLALGASDRQALGQDGTEFNAAGALRWVF